MLSAISYDYVSDTFNTYGGMPVNQSSETIELLKHSEILSPKVNQDQSEIDDWDDESSTTDSDNSLGSRKLSFNEVKFATN